MAGWIREEEKGDRVGKLQNEENHYCGGQRSTMEFEVPVNIERVAQNYRRKGVNMKIRTEQALNTTPTIENTRSCQTTYYIILHILLSYLK